MNFALNSQPVIQIINELEHVLNFFFFHISRFDQMAVKVTETKAAVDCLWKCYQVSFGFF